MGFAKNRSSQPGRLFSGNFTGYEESLQRQRAQRVRIGRHDGRLPPVAGIESVRGLVRVLGITSAIGLAYEKNPCLRYSVGKGAYRARGGSRSPQPPPRDWPASWPVAAALAAASGRVKQRDRGPSPSGRPRPWRSAARCNPGRPRHDDLGHQPRRGLRWICGTIRAASTTNARAKTVVAYFWAAISSLCPTRGSSIWTAPRQLIMPMASAQLAEAELQAGLGCWPGQRARSSGPGPVAVGAAANSFFLVSTLITGLPAAW